MIHEPVIVLGDLNTSPGSSPIIALGMADALRESSSELEWMGLQQSNWPKDDFILSRELMLSQESRLFDHERGRPASDHWPTRRPRVPRRPY